MDPLIAQRQWPENQVVQSIRRLFRRTALVRCDRVQQRFRDKKKGSGGVASC